MRARLLPLFELWSELRGRIPVGAFFGLVVGSLGSPEIDMNTLLAPEFDPPDVLFHHRVPHKPQIDLGYRQGQVPKIENRSSPGDRIGYRSRINWGLGQGGHR